MERDELRPLLRRNFPPQRTYLLPALHFVQEELGHLPEWALQIVAWHLRTPASVVYGAATSYTELRINAPTGPTVRVCTGLACWHGGGRELLEELSQVLTEDTRSPDGGGPVNMEETPCAYRCPLAPLAEVEGVWLGRTNSAQVLARLRE